MFVGHFAVGFAAKRWAPKVSFGTLILAASLSDVLWICCLGGTPPPSLSSLAIVNSVFFVFVLTWAYWMNRWQHSKNG